MGQSVYNTYVGAFIEVERIEPRDFRKILGDYQEEFENDKPEDIPLHYDSERFIDPYEGLEDLSILLPSNNQMSISAGAYVDMEGGGDVERSYEITESEMESVKKKLREEYKTEIQKLQDLFPDKEVKVKFGFVTYIDEIG